MSLINEALKRAQHLRKEEAAGHATPPPGDPAHRVAHRVAHRGKPMASQTLMLIVAGSVAIIVITVVATVYLLRDDGASPAVARAPAPAIATAPTAAPASAETAPAVVLSIPSQAAGTTAAPPVAATPVVTAPVPAPIAAKPTAPAPRPAAPVTPPVTPSTVPASVPAASVASTTPISTAPVATAPITPAPAAAANVAPDQQVLIYLDNMRVLGVRFSGLDSKVLIGDRVFRINDIIERNFGLRLVEVQPDRLFFVDARGAAYTKNL
jgi:hypothetical protein